MTRTAEPAGAIAEQELVDRVLASRHFIKAPLLSAFLRYTCQRVFVEGAPVRISEQEIGVDVFRRDEDYDPREDNIVRNYARQLRKRLDEYYAAEGSHESIRITLPKGGYVPAFVSPQHAFTHTEEDPELKTPEFEIGQDHLKAQFPLRPQEDSASPSNERLSSRTLLIACLVLTLILVILLFMAGSLYRKNGIFDKKNTHPLWSQIFQPNVTTTWVSPDSGLVLLTVSSRKQASLAEYIRQDFSQQTKGLSPERATEVVTMAGRRYTSFVDVEMVHRFDTQTAAGRSNFVIKFARDLHVNDLKQGNVILLGSPFSNPWVELYEPEMNFVGELDFEHRGFRFLNKNPRPNEPSNYSIFWNDSTRKLLGSVAFLPGLDRKGTALIVQGSSLAGGEAVEDYLLNDDAFLPFLASIRKPDGTLPFFELMLESTNIDGTPGSCRIVVSRVYN